MTTPLDTKLHVLERELLYATRRMVAAHRDGYESAWWSARYDRELALARLNRLAKRAGGGKIAELDRVVAEQATLLTGDK